MIISEQEKTITCSNSVTEIMSVILNSEHETDMGREHFWTIGLNIKNIIQFVELVSLGSSNTAIVNPREVFRFAVMKGVEAIILCHNHPSGDSAPSIEDINLTKRLADAGRTLDIQVLDHIILGKPDHHFSFYWQGYSNPRFREVLFYREGTDWQCHRDTIPASLRRRKSPKKNKSGEAVGAPVLQP